MATRHSYPFECRVIYNDGTMDVWYSKTAQDAKAQIQCHLADYLDVTKASVTNLRSGEKLFDTKTNQHKGK